MEIDLKLTSYLQKARAGSLKTLGWVPDDVEAQIALDSSDEEAVFVTLYLPSAKPYLTGPDYRAALAWAGSVLAKHQDDRPVYLRLAGEKVQAA